MLRERGVNFIPRSYDRKDQIWKRQLENSGSIHERGHRKEVRRVERMDEGKGKESED